MDDTQVVPITVHGADEAIAADAVDIEAESLETDDGEDESQEPIWKRMRVREPRHEEPVELERAGNDATKAEVESYGTIVHPEDGSAAQAVGANQRKRKGADELEWWLKLRWDGGFEKFPELLPWGNAGS